MALDAILLFALKSSVQMVVDRAGKEVYNRRLPPIKRATEAAVKRMAVDLGSKFPSVNFLEYNFRFDSPIAKDELAKLTSERELPDETVLKKEMSKEVAQKWPEYLSSAGEIVEVFLKYFEEECLSIPELHGFALASIIKRGDTATQQTVLQAKEEIITSLKTFILESRIMPGVGTQEVEITKISSALEKRIVKERDDLIDAHKRWQSKNLHHKVEALAKEVLDLKDSISHEIAGSIFRLCGSDNLRTFRNKERAKHWIDLAKQVDPSNDKTVALEAELLCLENKWEDAYRILLSIAEKTSDSFPKIIFSECLSHLSGAEAAFDWLTCQESVKEDDEIRLNIVSLAIKIKRYNVALKILDHLVAKPFPGPYPYLFKAEIFVNQAMPQESVVISAPEDLDLRRSDELIMLAIDNLKIGITFLETAARPLEIPPHVQVLSELYIAAGDLKSAEKTLCNHWKSLRKENTSWFTASTIAFLGGHKEKALIRALKALTLSRENDHESLIRFGLISLNAGAWDKCLDAINSIRLEKLDDGHLKGVFQMKALCYYHKGLPELVDENIKALRSQFIGDETWIILQALILKLSGKSEQAIHLLANELNNFPDSVKIKLRLAAQYKDEQKYDSAFPLYKDLAGALMQTKLYEEACRVGLYGEMAREVISMVIEAENKGIASDHIRHFKAIALAINKQYGEALELFSKFDEASLSHNDYIFYALCLTHKARSADAVSLLEKGKNKFPQDTRIIRGLFSLHLELNAPERALIEAKLWLKLDPNDKGAYFASIQTGFAVGEQEFAHNALIQYLSRFGEGPELRSGTLEDIKKHLKIASERSEFLWDKYQKGLLPEIIVSNESNLGIAGHRITLLNSTAKVMAFNGTPDSQNRQFIDTQAGKTLLLDYHALITIHLLNLIDPVISLFQRVAIPEVVLEKIREDLTGLPLTFQRDKREIQEGVFSKLKSTFQIYDKFLEINPKDIPETLGNSVFDVLTCQQNNCFYVTPAFEKQEVGTVKETFDVEAICLLDLIDLMKEKGIITVKRYEDVLEILKKYNLKRFSKLESPPKRAILNWNALEMLEECKLLEDLPKLIEARAVGPFTYALLHSEIDRYKRIDEVQNIIANIENKIRGLIDKGICSLIPTPGGGEKAKERLPKHIRGIDYLEDLQTICSIGDFVLWTDDLALCSLLASDNKRTTCTRTILDVLSDKGIIKEEERVYKILSLLKWRMHFCWINANTIIKCSEMYDYSKSDDVTVMFRTLTDEITTFPNHVPNHIEISNFNVASEAIRKLWIISEKAQSLAMGLFDEVLACIGSKEILRRYWIVMSILGVALVGEVPLVQFLRSLSLRIAESTLQIIISPYKTGFDELLLSLKMLIELCLKEGSRELIPASAKGVVVGRVIRSVRQSIPSFADSLAKWASQIDPAVKALI
jgi:lipopolysaccharide biosynthesis regulator YciM